MAFKQTITYSGTDAQVEDGRLLVNTSGAQAPNLVKQYSFPIGSITGGAAHFDIYTDIPLNGTLQAIEWASGNNTATGSLTIYRSGASATQIWGMISGTATHMLAESFVVFPKAACVGTADESLSTNWYSDITLDNYLRVVGSSVGAAKSGLGLNITYI